MEKELNKTTENTEEVSSNAEVHDEDADAVVDKAEDDLLESTEQRLEEVFGEEKSESKDEDEDDEEKSAEGEEELEKSTPDKEKPADKTDSDTNSTPTESEVDNDEDGKKGTTKDAVAVGVRLQAIF